MSDPQILSEDEAVWVERPDSIGEPWFWSGPINAITSDSYRIKLEWTAKLEAIEHSLRCLYRCGYAIAAVSPKAQDATRHALENRERGSAVPPKEAT